MKKLPVQFLINRQVINANKLPRMVSALSIDPFDSRMRARMKLISSSQKIPEDIEMEVEVDSWIYINKYINSLPYSKKGSYQSNDIQILLRGSSVALLKESQRFTFSSCKKIYDDIMEKIKSLEGLDKPAILNLKQQMNDEIYKEFENRLILLKIERQIKNKDNDENIRSKEQDS